MSKTSYHHIIQSKITSQDLEYIGDVGLFILFSCFFGKLFFFALYSFSSVSHRSGFRNPKNCRIGEISRVFRRRRANAIPRPRDVMIVPVVLMQCSSDLVFRSEPGGRKWLAFCCTYISMGGSDSYYAHVVICGFFKDHMSCNHISTS